MGHPSEKAPWDFEKLTDAISYFRQPPSKQAQDTPAPSLVILCTWMGANRKHITKYTQQHRQQYPNADLLVIESSVADVIYRPDQTQQQRMRPAHDILLSHRSGTEQYRGQQQILLHVFSNGGCQSALQLVSGLPSDLRRHAFSGIVFDSCPGMATYQRSYHAMSLSLPKSGTARLVGIPLLHIMLCLFNLYYLLFAVEDVISKWRKQLNDPALFNLDVPRLYIYSKADQLVWDQDVQRHAADARRQGFLSVQEMSFEASGHCAHALAHKDEYWKVVEALVRRSQSTKSG